MDNQYFETSFTHDICNVFCDHNAKFHILILAIPFRRPFKVSKDGKTRCKMLGTGGVFGVYFNTRDRLVL